jgi:NYN domain
LDDVKVRLGFINSAGQQKGVDSLIVTDLIELARQKAICDAILLSGDEDVRIGVQIAQNYGIRIHLLGISPSRGSQSLTLLQEADTTTEWDQQTVRRFLSERPKPNQQLGNPANGGVALTAAIDVSIASVQGSDSRLEQAAIDFCDALQPADIEGLSAYWASGSRGLPSETDRRALPCGRQAVGRDLEGAEKRFIRSRIQQIVTDKAKD